MNSTTIQGYYNGNAPLGPKYPSVCHSSNPVTMAEPIHLKHLQFNPGVQSRILSYKQRRRASKGLVLYNQEIR